MKCIQRLSSVFLASCLTLNSTAVMSKGIEDLPLQTSSAETEQPLIMAQLKLPKFIRDTSRTIKRLEQMRAQQRRREELLRRRQEWEARREERRAEFLRRQQELEVARREATEQQRLEAERRQQYFESLSPEQKQAYLAEQRARREQADKAAALLLMTLFAGGFGSGDGGSNQSEQNDMCEFYYPTPAREGTMAQGNPCR
jgi:FtsZ-interacting cell division protein ZipA